MERNYAKKEETREIKAKRLLWQSRKRGISENDLLLSTWFKKAEPTLSDEDLDAYCSLINGDVNEWDLFYWMSGTKPVPEEWDNSIMHSLQKHCGNDKREERFFQPATENSKSVWFKSLEKNENIISKCKFDYLVVIWKLEDTDMIRIVKIKYNKP
jgi:succinate dehydrogenase assembly factor 2